MTEENQELAEAAVARREDLMESESGFTGECREATPFGETFSIFSNGKEYTSCTHSPPHTHLVN